MRTTAIILLFVVAALASEDLFMEIKKTEFGKTLTQTIMLQLETNTQDNIGHVIEMVKQVRKDLRTQKQENDDAHGVVADACRADFDEFDRKVDRLEATVVKNQRLLSIDGPVLEDRQAEQAARRDELDARQASLATLGEENDAQVAAFQAVVAEHAAVRTMMHQARNIVTEAFKGDGSSFLEVKTNAWAKLSSQIKAFKPISEQGISHGYAQIFNVIALIAERAPQVGNQGMVDTILRIFDDIEENLENSLAIEREAERQREEAHNTLRTRLTDEVNGLFARISALGREVLNLQLSVSGYQDTVDMSNGAIADANALRADRQASCGAEDAAYQFKNQELSDQIVVCGNAIYLMEDKRDLLERYRSG